MYLDILQEQVAQTVPKGDFALLLSGGIDSSILAYLMRPPVCITVRYPGEDRLDESKDAAEIARRIGAQLIVVEPTAEDFTSALPLMITALDYPMGNASAFSEYMAYRAAAECGIRVVVGGLGPDEFLMGYARHALAIFGWADVLNAGMKSYLPLAEKLRNVDGRDLSLIEVITKLILRGPDQGGRISRIVSNAIKNANGDLARALTLSELETAWRPLVMTSDKLASSLSLERRSPFLARQLVELSYRLPIDFKIESPDQGKRILRDVADMIGLPSRISFNRDKIGFSSPLPMWLNDSLASWTDSHIESAMEIA